ncbi:uncharacterized protein LAESUDRAFT_759387 [Laetiporus sulphureus 93-53]|uniref:Uncharacterized protein n=1 Tax=Laetiporus sulphureus 93-53 TaxID=1314785 RepID=A0A165EA34_9APHY|nr:uncharacterized protein LAESUDRAFT_759387 [Laetiporus sulphureus 93-53]KZT06567.1 hypothetical protein LAESUDRAFT_759387 [Laetiporus sulphureus 93-53]
MFFKQWDMDCYASVGTFLYNNYRQALDILNSEAVQFDKAKGSLGITDDDIARWCKEKVEYFANIEEESEWDVWAVAYVELLQEYYALEEQHANATASFLMTTPSDYEFMSPSLTGKSHPIYSQELSRTHKLERQRHHVSERRMQVLRDVIDMEVRMCIVDHWQPTSQEYRKTMEYIRHRKYHRAVDNLQRLVIQQLFELHNMNLAQTAYRIRTHIVKSLQTRCKAIHNAVDTYNALAVKMTPPRPTLDWNKVTHYTFLEEFNLLRDTGNILHEKPWAHPAVCAVMKQANRLARAHEELEHLNVEIC